MKRNHRIVCVWAVSAMMMFTAASPAAASSGTEVMAGSETESEALAEVLGVAQEVIGDALLKGYENSLSIDAKEPLQELISGALKGTDMSWLENVTFEGASSGNEDGGLDASGVISLNDTELYHGSVSIDADDRIIYLSCPEFRKTPAAVDLAKLEDTLSGGKDKESGKASSGTGDMAEKAFRPDYTRLAKEAGDLFTSLTPKKLGDFADRYGEVLLENASFSSHENVTLTAGALSEAIRNTTVTVDPTAMAHFLTVSIDKLKEDPLICEMLESDFAADLTNTILFAMDKDTVLGPDEVTDGYLSLLNTLEKEDFSVVPGFTLTYGYDGEGRLAMVEFGLLYSGASVNIFSLKMLQRETHIAVQFDLGGLVSALIAKYWQGNPNGRTGILLEADKASDVIHDSFLITAADEEIASVYLDDFLIGEVEKGILNGTMTLNAAGGVYSAEFSHPEKGTEVITGKYNDTEYVVLTAKAEAVDKAEVDKLSRKKAMEVYDQSTWDEYIKDAKLSKMFKVLPKAGVPESIMDMLTSGEAGTEKSRENTDEVDGTGDMKNGEVGGADIGKDD